MQITFPCPHCAAPLGIPARRAGAAVRCPACDRELVVPPESRPIDWPNDDEPGRTPPRAPLGAVDPADSPFRIETKRKTDEGMDLTPMVDVTFLLLIFFMITASFSVQKTLETPAPDPDTEGASQQLVDLEELEQESILVRIEPPDRVFVDGEPLTDPDGLADRLRAVMNADGKTELVIQASGEARHEAVVRAYDARRRGERRTHPPGRRVRRLRPVTPRPPATPPPRHTALEPHAWLFWKSAVPPAGSARRNCPPGGRSRSAGTPPATCGSTPTAWPRCTAASVGTATATA